MDKIISLAALLLIIVACTGKKNIDQNWAVAGGDLQRQQFSTLEQIDTSNVSELRIAWVYHTRDALQNTQIQCNPLIINGILYGTSPSLKLFALNAATGEELWSYSPRTSDQDASGLNTNRGVAYWTDANKSKLFYVVGPNLICINAETGKPDEGFGEGGAVDLRIGLDRDASSLYVTATSPGVIFRDMLILGSRVSESNPAAPGHIRAFDVHTGQIRWIFHTIPHPGEIGFETWEDQEAYKRVGGANSWSGLSLDISRKMVFASTGSAAFDFYGGDRKGDNLFANSIVAIDAETGTYKWHFQTIHHDVWDRDLPAPPILSTIDVNGKAVDVAIQATKTGYIFVLDRETGKPVFPVNEVSVPDSSELIGEKLSPTQPMPESPVPFMDQEWRIGELRKMISDSSYRQLMERISTYKSGHIFTPPSEEGTIFFPGLDGGAEWGGSSFDKRTGHLYINANRVPWIITNLRKTGDAASLTMGELVYQEQCMSCHGKSLGGAGNYPGLLNISQRMEETGVLSMIKNGKGMMPAFGFLDEDQRQAVAEYILNFSPNNPISTTDTSYFRGYSISGYDKLQTLEGFPAVDPPWGTLNALDISSGELVWSKPLGNHPKVSSGSIQTGSENYGGPVATSGGTVFIASTPDKMIRAFRMTDGELLWEFELPFAGFATPAIYDAGGKQYVVIACGGGKLGSPSGDIYMAFTLP